MGLVLINIVTEGMEYVYEEKIGRTLSVIMKIDVVVMVPIEVTLVGIYTEVSDTISWKAPVPIDVTLVGKVILVKGQDAYR